MDYIDNAEDNMVYYISTKFGFLYDENETNNISANLILSFLLNCNNNNWTNYYASEGVLRNVMEETKEWWIRTSMCGDCILDDFMSNKINMRIFYDKSWFSI